MMVIAPKNKKEFLTMTEDSLSNILVDLSQLLVNLMNYDGLDDDVLFDIALKISSSYGGLTILNTIVKSEIKDLEGE
jgi:hypothetical protein|nr:MAG TPA: hypothetical protein [Caudoviricetes sp.]